MATELSVNLEPGMIMQKTLFVYLKFVLFFGSCHVYLGNVVWLWEKNKGIYEWIFVIFVLRDRLCHIDLIWDKISYFVFQGKGPALIK